MRWTLGLALPIAAAVALALRCSRNSRERLALGAAAAGVLTGAASLPWAALLFGGVRGRGWFTIDDAVLWTLVTMAIWLYGRRPDPVNVRGPEPSSAAERGLALVLLVTTVSIAAAAFFFSSTVAPHGEWDAWAQWNLRARFFYRGLADGTWRMAFDPILAWSHADYPPMVPVSVARLWLYAGRETVAAPIALAALMSSAVVVLAAASVWQLRGAARGGLVAAAILACPSFVRWAPSQCADIPLAFFMLAACVMWQQDRLLLAGLAAGLAAWTKNEGQAFLVIFLALVTVSRLHAGGWRGVLPVLAGAAPIGIAVFLFKHALAPPSYFVQEQTLAQALHKLTDTGRAEFIGRVLGRQLWFSGASYVGVLPIAALYALVRGRDGSSPPAVRYGGVAAVLMLAVYALAYLVTPKDLVWQLQTSVDRVVLQLLPTLLWAVLCFAA